MSLLTLGAGLVANFEDIAAFDGAGVAADDGSSGTIGERGARESRNEAQLANGGLGGGADGRAP